MIPMLEVKYRIKYGFYFINTLCPWLNNNNNAYRTINNARANDTTIVVGPQ